jgi:hypothetical protein
MSIRFQGAKGKARFLSRKAVFLLVTTMRVVYYTYCPILSQILVLSKEKTYFRRIKENIHRKNI